MSWAKSSAGRAKQVSLTTRTALCVVLISRLSSAERPQPDSHRLIPDSIRTSVLADIHENHREPKNVLKDNIKKADAKFDSTVDKVEDKAKVFTEKTLGWESEKLMVVFDVLREQTFEASFVVIGGPLLVSVWMVAATTAGSRNNARQSQTNWRSFLLSTLATQISAYAMGYCLDVDTKYTFKDPPTIGAGAMMLICPVMAFRSAGIVFGWPEFPRGLRCFGLLLGLVFAGALNLFWYLHYYYCVREFDAPDDYVQLIFYSLVVAAMMYLRVVSLFPSFLFIKAWEMLYFAMWHRLDLDKLTDMPHFYPAWACTAMFAFLCCYTVHLRDQQIIGCFGCLVMLSVRLGNLQASKHYTFTKLMYWRIPLNLFLMYVSVIFARRRRTLPTALEKCGYVRLGFLRSLVREGKPLKRHQDLPINAFGDAAKAQFLIITSHRWLNRLTCDVATPEYPAGLRLNSMLSRLDVCFPESWRCGELLAPLMSIRVCGFDALLFFDFMALPQIGQAEDGSKLERTEEEQQLFQQALPEMGALYTMYPVLVIPEVTLDVHAYLDSGWCFCEFEQALLCNQLWQYSSAFVETLEAQKNECKDERVQLSSKGIMDDAPANSFDEKAAQEFVGEFEDAMTTKKFYFDADRDTVRGIVKGKMISRQLADAVKLQDVDKVRHFLGMLAEEKLTHQMNHPVDERADTLLHLAMRLPSKEIVDCLLKVEGIDENARNLRGDRPSQWFLFPVGIRKSLCCCLSF